MKKYSILVADDQQNACDGIKEALQNRFAVDTANSLQEAINLWNERQHDIVITDLCMPAGTEGLDLLQHIKSRSPNAAVILMTAYGDIETAVKAMKLGALDFFIKPFTAEEIEIKIDNVLKTITLVAANQNLSKTIDDDHALIGESAVMQALKKRISRVAQSDASILITGPHGTGKELVAWAIQRASARADKPFIRVNCAAIAETLIEAELFGSEKGSYTGSSERKPGKFQQSDRGTLFLDEVGDMSLAAQAKLLRALESGEITPVGSTKTLLVDVRIIAATNKNLKQLIKDKQFREDLFYRLNGVPVETRALADHTEDIPALVTHFLKRMGRSSDVEKIFSKAAVECLMNWTWPGNIRELKNVVERTVILCEEGSIGAEDVKNNISSGEPVQIDKTDTNKTLKDARTDFERMFISIVLKESKTIAEAAEKLGLQRSYLHQKMNELGIGNQ